jgi:hypothetical protein
VKSIHLACLFSFQLILLGCSNTPTSVAQNPKEKSLSAEGVPSIAIVFDCGQCDVSRDVVKRISESYMNAAGAAGVRVSASETATLRIESFSDRGAGRLFIAAVAGPLAMIFHVDRIKGRLSSRAGEFQIEETARFPFVTIDTVAKNVGEAAFKEVARK